MHRRTTALSLIALAAVVNLWPVPSSGQTAPPASRADRLRNERENEALQKVAPFKAFDNLYFVGVGYVGAWLLTTSDGLILIDAVDEQYADHLLDNIRKVGFDPKNVKYLIVTQSHFDHYGAATRLQEMYGARLAMGEADWPPVLEAAGRANARARAPKRDIALKDGDKITLGTTTITAHATPGHSPGTTSLEFDVYDNGKPYRALFHAGVAPAAGMTAAEQSMASIEKVERLQDRIQVRLVSHPWMDPEFWDRADRLQQRKATDPHPMVSNQVFRAWVGAQKETMVKNLEAVRAGKPQPPRR